jgi:hypothetical protein
MQNTKDIPQFDVPYATTKRTVKEAFGPYAEFHPDDDAPLQRWPNDVLILWCVIVCIYSYVGYLLFGAPSS